MLSRWQILGNGAKSIAFSRHVTRGGENPQPHLLSCFQVEAVSTNRAEFETGGDAVAQVSDRGCRCHLEYLQNSNQNQKKVLTTSGRVGKVVFLMVELLKDHEVFFSALPHLFHLGSELYGRYGCCSAGWLLALPDREETSWAPY